VARVKKSLVGTPSGVVKMEDNKGTTVVFATVAAGVTALVLSTGVAREAVFSDTLMVVLTVSA
jgi:hypothetical protein